MSKFYTEISKYYDYIFPTANAKLGLIRELAGDTPKDILDVACGSGGYSKKLKNLGYNVTAIDLDNAMISQLKEIDGEIDARVLNMLDIDRLNKKFDLIFCIGNSMVHLNDNEEIQRFLEKCKNSLKPGGHLLIQIVNYDRILENDVKSLPTIENKEIGLIFERYYEYLPEKHKIDFKTVLKVDGLNLENHVLLHPITSKELIGLLERLEYKNIKLYGNFNKDVYEPMKSFPLVITAQI